MFTVFDALSLLCGLALFLYGMQVMSDGLKKSAGTKLKSFLDKMTSSPVRGFFLGLAVTAVVQSSSATTVMVVGFVNSGTMTLAQSVGVIIGANVGATVTYWLTALSSLGEGAEISSAVQWLKPGSWVPILAIVGVGILMFIKRGKKRDIAAILIGFAVLMCGMDMMSGAVGGLAENESFAEMMTLFRNPLFGILAGTLITAVVQSSAASVGILQSLCTTGVITYNLAVPIILGQNIGTCITAILSSIGANKNGKRAALIHLYYNIICSSICLALYCLVTAIIDIPFLDGAISAWGVAAVHTAFKIVQIGIGALIAKPLVKLATLSVPDKDKGTTENVNLLDERLFNTPTLAVQRATDVTVDMAKTAYAAMTKAMSVFNSYDMKLADEVRDLEERADIYEDNLGTYLVKLSSCSVDEADHRQITKLLHIIGDLERISDHSVNIVESAEEMREKKITFSGDANREMTVIQAAVAEILNMAIRSFTENNVQLAGQVEPLEEVVDELRDRIKLNHVLRLQKSECTIEHGFVLSDMLTNYERVADHCSNIAGCVIEISEFSSLNMHEYLDSVKRGGDHFKERFEEYRKKYSL